MGGENGQRACRKPLKPTCAGSARKARSRGPEGARTPQAHPARRSTGQGRRHPASELKRPGGMADAATWLAAVVHDRSELRPGNLEEDHRC
jgi:hypothetical protein